MPCAREAAQIFGGASYVRGGQGEKVRRAPLERRSAFHVHTLHALFAQLVGLVGSFRLFRQCPDASLADVSLHIWYMRFSLGCLGTFLSVIPAVLHRWSGCTATCARTPSRAGRRQGLTLVYFSAQLERCSWDRGCA